jgi:hypothetical protein
MPEDFHSLDQLRYRDAATAELDYIRSLGTNPNLILATANLGAYEAILYIMSSDEWGVPVYQAITNVRSGYSTQSGILARLRAMRKLGLVEDRPGHKKSQVCLAPSQSLLRELGPLLLKRHGGAQ